MNENTKVGSKERAVKLAADEGRLVHMLKALANPVRFQIMRTLSERQACITQDIVDATPLAQSTVSQHLKVLREAGLIRGEIEGPATCYCVDSEGVLWLKQRLGSWLAGCCDTPAESISLHVPEIAGKACNCR